KINAKPKAGLPGPERPTATAENPPSPAPAEAVPAPVAAPHNPENPELPKGAPAPSEPPGAADKKSGG
ncbi:hypothetical protein MZTS_24760, partial [Methylorubrum zatmanii]|nr:hypothetical protein [Methylorubrum zatmanii]